MRVAPLFVCSVDALAQSAGRGCSGTSALMQLQGIAYAAVPPGTSVEPGDPVQSGERWF
jgi:hypothetical protein